MHKINLKPVTENKINDLQKILHASKIIAYPTDTIYGLGADIYDEIAVKKLFQLKGRSFDKPVSVLYSSIDRLLSDFTNISDFQKQFIYEFMPGSVTIILPINSNKTIPLPFIKNGCVGVRVIDLPELNTLLSEYPNPISTTSINPAGLKPANTIDEINSYFQNEISLFIDNGKIQNTKPSTIIKVSESNYSIIRESTITKTQIAQRIIIK